MSSTVNLKLDFTTHAAAMFAVKSWHYSKSLPPPPLVRVGVWENHAFIGVVVFARGANRHLGAPFGLAQTECCELVRVALNAHKTPVSRIVAIALRMLKKCAPGLRLVISFADPAQGHRGCIYQAGGWIYAGDTPPSLAYKDRAGKVWHSRMVATKGSKRVFGRVRKVITPAECITIKLPGKHRYLMPLDKEMAARLTSCARKYIRASSSDSGTAAIHAERGGANPTDALH